jgi:hypothetical protein
VAALTGFDDAASMASGVRRIAAALESSPDVDPLDWRRALTATEVAFASDEFGVGVEWEACTGLEDAHTIDVLRRLQRKLVVVL